MHSKCKVIISLEYRLVRKLGEGTFSEVLKAESVKTKQKVAIKCMKSHFDNIEKVLNFGIFDIGTKSKRN